MNCDRETEIEEVCLRSA